MYLESVINERKAIGLLGFRLNRRGWQANRLQELDSPELDNIVPGWAVGPLHRSAIAMNSYDTSHATLTQRNEQNIVVGVEHLGQLPP